MAASSTAKQVGGLTVAGLGLVAVIIGVAGAVGAWGETTTEGEPEVSVEILRADGTTVTTEAATPDSTTTTTAVEPETVEAFLDALASALASGDTEYQLSRLHPEVIARYGADQCRATFDSIPADPTAAFELVTQHEPADYTWVTDDVTSVIPDTVSVDVVRTVQGTPNEVTVHITRAGDGTFRFFSDCGTPI